MKEIKAPIKVYERENGKRIICELYPAEYSNINHFKLKAHHISAEVYTHTGKLMSKQLTEVPSEEYKVIFNPPATIVILDDGSKGVAKCSPNDLYNRQIGYDIAHARAKIQQLENEIKRLINP